HLDRALLERQQASTVVAGAFGKYPDRGVAPAQRVTDLPNRLVGPAAVATVDQDVARQPVDLAEQWNPFQAFLADADGAARHHATDHEQVQVRLVIGDEYTGLRMGTQHAVVDL